MECVVTKQVILGGVVRPAGYRVELSNSEFVQLQKRGFVRSAAAADVVAEADVEAEQFRKDAARKAAAEEERALAEATADDLDALDREQLKQLVDDEGHDISKRLGDDNLRDAIRAARAAKAEATADDLDAEDEADTDGSDEGDLPDDAA